MLCTLVSTIPYTTSGNQLQITSNTKEQEKQPTLSRGKVINRIRLRDDPDVEIAGNLK